MRSYAQPITDLYSSVTQVHNGRDHAFEYEGGITRSVSSLMDQQGPPPTNKGDQTKTIKQKI